MTEKQPITIVLDDNPKGVNVGFQCLGSTVIGVRMDDALEEIERLEHDIEDLKHDIANALQTASQEADFATEAMKCRDTLIEALEALIIYYEKTKQNRIAWEIINDAKKALAKAKGEDEV